MRRHRASAVNIRLLRSQNVRLALAFSLLLGILQLSCGGGSGGSAPTGSTPGPTGPSTPTPTPEPTPHPTPTPAITSGCAPLPEGSGTSSGCSKRESARFFPLVREAVEMARGSTYMDPDSGEVVNLVDSAGQIIAARAYVDTILAELDSAGLCAVFDGEEIQVRDTGADNENFDVITSRGFSWINYVVTCSPALPIPDPPQVPQDRPDPTCALPPSAPYLCVKQSAALEADVYGAQDDLIATDRARETPLVFDFSDRIGGTEYGYKLISPTAYTEGMLEHLRARGLCAKFDGEEFNVKSGTNIFSENYDLTRRDFYAVRIYNATCRDASY